MAGRRILIIKLGALGDVVQALGPMAAIRCHHADDHITVLTRKPFDQLIDAAGIADALRFDPKPGPVDLGGWLALRGHLRREGFDRVYDLQTSSRSGRYFRLFWPGPYPEWSGIAKGCSHPHVNAGRDHMHTLERQAEQLNMAGISEAPPPSLDGVGAPSDALGLPSRFTLLVPGGAEHRPEKRWPAARYRALAERLDAGPAPALVIGNETERPLAEEITQGLANARNIAGETSLLQLVDVARRAEAAVGNDSGPMHIAATVGTKSVVLFSAASDPALCGQRGADVTVLRRGGLDELTVDEVWAALG